MFNFWWSARLVDGLEPHLPPSPAKKIKCSFLDYIQLLVIGRANRWTWIPSATPLQPKKWNPHFWIMFNFWWSARLVNGLEPHPPPLYVHFWIVFNFWWSAEWFKQKTSTKMQKNEKGPLSHWIIKCSFLDYVQLLMIGQTIWAKNDDQNTKKNKTKKAP